MVQPALTLVRVIIQTGYRIIFTTTFKLKEGVNPKEFDLKLRELLVKYVGPLINKFLGITLEDFEKGGNTYGFTIQPLKDIHLNSRLAQELEPNGNKLYVYIFFSGLQS